MLQMTASFGWGMLLYGLVCIFIGATIVYLVINRKTPEQLEQEENEEYLRDLRNKL